MLLRSLAGYGHVLEPGRLLLEERTLAQVRLEQDDVELGPGRGKRDPRRASTGADVDDGSRIQKPGRHEGGLEQGRTPLVLGPDRCQARRLAKRGEPAVEPLVRSRQG